MAKRKKGIHGIDGIVPDATIMGPSTKEQVAYLNVSCHIGLSKRVSGSCSGSMRGVRQAHVAGSYIIGQGREA